MVATVRDETAGSGEKAGSTRSWLSGSLARAATHEVREPATGRPC